jgi:HK97 gp10 family phage protein
MIETKVEVVDNIPEITAKAVVGTAAAIEKTAKGIKKEAKDRSRVESGEMRDGWEAVEHDQFEWEVLNEVEHTIYNEFGTVYMSAQPMLGPAVQNHKAELERDIAEAWNA